MNAKITQTTLDRLNVSANGRFVGLMSAEEILMSARAWAQQLRHETKKDYSGHKKFQPCGRRDTQFQHPITGEWSNGWDLRQAGIELEGLNRRDIMRSWLDADGQTGYSRNRDAMQTPIFVATTLESGWKRGAYGNIISYRSIGRLLKDLAAAAPEWVALVQEWVVELDAQENASNKAAAERRANAALEELEKAISRVKELGIWTPEMAERIRGLAQ